jgi:hypothetical protein
MARLKIEDLQVSSFETSVDTASTGTVIDTQQVDCWSPLCMDTQQRTCPTKETVAAGA